MRSSVVAPSNSRPRTTPAAGMRNTWTVGWEPLHTTTTPGAGWLGAPGPSAISTEYSALALQGVMTSVVTFDAGQTLVELDLDFLARRLGEQGLSIAPAALEAAAPAAWRRYDA